jgi:hypothetical protein
MEPSVARSLKKQTMVWSLLWSPGVGHLMIFLGKEKGKMITLPNFLKAHSSELRTEFDALSNEEKGALHASYLEAKDEKENTLMRISNIAISKAVDAKMQHITAMVCSCSFYCLNMFLTLL